MPTQPPTGYGTGPLLPRCPGCRLLSQRLCELESICAETVAVTKQWRATTKQAQDGCAEALALCEQWKATAQRAQDVCTNANAVIARQAEELRRLREQNIALCRRLAGEEVKHE